MADLKYYDVILKPVVTEKSITAMAEKKIYILRKSGRNKNTDQRSCGKNVRRNKSCKSQHHEP